MYHGIGRHILELGLANYGPWGKPAAVCICKHIFNETKTHPFTYILSVAAFMTELNSGDRPLGPQNLK